MNKIKEAKKLEVDKLLSPKACEIRCGHRWVNFMGNSKVNALGFNIEPNTRYIIAGSAEYRICCICGTKQVLIPEEWKTIKNEELEELKQALKEEKND